jgi:phage terminase small subunit
MNNQIDTIKLTVKQEKYVQGLFLGLSQREAYKLAYDCKEMTDKTIDEAACRLADASKVVARLDQLKASFAIQNTKTVQKIVNELSKIAFSDIKDYLTYKTEKTVVGIDEKTGQPIVDYRQIIDVMESNKVDGSVIQEVSVSRDGTFKFKLHDKIKSLELMGKHFGMFTEKVELDNKVTINFEESLLNMIKRNNVE